MTDVGLIRRDPGKLPVLADVRSCTWLDRLLWFLLTMCRRNRVAAPGDRHGLAIIMPGAVAARLYGLKNPGTCVGEVVLPHGVPAPLDEDDLP